jgi:hypothetical protein
MFLVFNFRSFEWRVLKNGFEETPFFKSEFLLNVSVKIHVQVIMPRFSFQFMCHVATCPDSCKLHLYFLTQNCPVDIMTHSCFLEWMGAQLVEPFRGHEISGRIVLRPGLCPGLRYVVPN